jgi:homeobox protein cut-like
MRKNGDAFLNGELLNTTTLVNHVKSLLISESLNQKLFGRAVLNVAESTVSLLMKNPKTWNRLSERGKEPYYKMFLWLNDSRGIEKLKSWIDKCTCLFSSNSRV